MIEIITGNICSLGAMICDSVSGTRKTKKGILIFQSISQLFYLSCAVILKGYSAAAQNVVSIFRNLYGTKDKQNKAMEYVFIILPVILGLYFNNLGLLGLIPIIANLQYALFLFFSKNTAHMKLSFVVCCMLFSYFNFNIQNYVGGICCIVTSVTTALAVIKEKKSAKE